MVIDGRDVLVTDATLADVLRQLAARSHGSGVSSNYFVMPGGNWLFQCEIDGTLYSSSQPDVVEAVRDVVMRIP